MEKFLSGFKKASQDFKVSLIGGDITQSNKITISVTIIGRGDRVIYRNGARPGDGLYVSGTLGDAGQGMLMAEQGIELGADRKSDYLLAAFFDPFPQISLGNKISNIEIASAMIDISDGLSVDLGHICEASGTGAELFLEKLPLSDELCTAQDNPYELALHGGEDYKLLFSVPKNKEDAVSKLQEGHKVTRIGRIISGDRIFTIDAGGKRELLEVKGFQHFGERET